MLCHTKKFNNKIIFEQKKWVQMIQPLSFQTDSSQLSASAVTRTVFLSQWEKVCRISTKPGSYTAQRFSNLKLIGFGDQ